jgi:hypothetical protein
MSEVKAMLHPLTTANFETVDTCKTRLMEQAHVSEEAEKLQAPHNSHIEL